MKAVVWNVARQREAWDLLEVGPLQSDIALLNEAGDTGGRSGLFADRTEGRDDYDRPWAAGIMTAHPVTPITDARPSWRGQTKDVPFQCSRPGSWIAGRVDVPGQGMVTAVSLYGLMDEFSDASVHRSLSEICPLIDDPRYASSLLLGGDLNTGTQWPAEEENWNARDQNILDRLAAWGLVDCVDARREAGRLQDCRCTRGEACRHVRTRRDSRYPGTPYQTDYLFASADLAARLVSCEVLCTDQYFAVSDHAPIVAVFD